MQINYIFRLVCYSCPRVDVGLVNIYSFELIYKSMSLFKYILCFKETDKDYKRFLVQSKKMTISDVNVALANLDFYVYAASELPWVPKGFFLFFVAKLR